MLPSLGLFRTTACPHCVAGLCNRPNCFLSHKKTDAKQKALRDKLQLPLDESLPLPPVTVPPTTKPSTSSLSNESIPGSSKEILNKHANNNSERKKENGIFPSGDKEKVVNGKNGITTLKSTTKSLNTTERERSRKRTISESKDESQSTTSSKESKKLKFDQQNQKSSKVDKVEKKSDFTNLTNRKSSSKPDSKLNDESETKTKPKHLENKVTEKDIFTESNNETGIGKKLPDDDFEDFANLLPDDDDNIHEDSSEFLYPVGNEEFEDDPDQVEFECLQMFNSYKPPSEESKKKTSIHVETITNNISADAIGKKRVAHPATIDYPKKSLTPPRPRISASEAMMQRYQKLKEQRSNSIIEKKEPTQPTTKSSNIQEIPSTKKRIAHVSNVSGLMKPQVTSSSNLTKPNASSSSGTIAQTVGKGQARQAHMPKTLDDAFEVPKISFESTKYSKVPIIIRQKILEQMFQECRKIYIESRDAAERALAEEKDLSTRCSSKAVYICSGTNVVARLRKEASQGTTNVISGSGKSAMSHLSVLAGPGGVKNSWSIESAKKMLWPPSGLLLYIGMKHYLLTEEQLVENCYPRKSPVGGGRAVAKSRNSTPESNISHNNPLLRTCERCMKSYKVNLDGLPVIKEQCTYHYGRKFKRRTNGVIDGRYTCCDGDTATEGCCVSDYHVSSNHSAELRGFVTAIKEPGDEDKMGSDPWDIVAIDCEMIYTTCGNELARATFIGSKLQVLYDELVKPIHPILDYNTRYSGITEEMLRNTTKTLTDVQAVLLTNLKPNSILVGHSLESDLLALKLIHNSVVDTSVLFPHRLGPPFKRALRNLATECLGKIIQMGEGGHDSAEDAKSSLEVVLWKLKEDNKVMDMFSKA